MASEKKVPPRHTGKFSGVRSPSMHTQRFKSFQSLDHIQKREAKGGRCMQFFVSYQILKHSTTMLFEIIKVKLYSMLI